MIDITSETEASGQVHEIRVETKDGSMLGATVFDPPDRARGTILIHGAAATPQRFYRHFARELGRQGLRVLTYDYRGIGASRPSSLRGFVATMTDWARLDASALHAFVEQHFGGEPLAIVGHSFGGQLIGLVDEAREASGALLVGAQLGYYGHFPIPDRFGLGILWRTVPWFTAAFGFLPGRIGIGEDLPRGVADEWARWCRTEDYYLSEHPGAFARLSSYDRPICAYRFADDHYAPRRAVEALTSRLTSAELDVRRVAPEDYGGEPIGHFGFFRPRFRETLWRESVDFLTAVLEGRTTGPRTGGLGIGRADVMEDLMHHGWG